MEPSNSDEEEENPIVSDRTALLSSNINNDEGS